MADEKKPKIDLKARLGRTGLGGQSLGPGAAVPPPPASSVPAPVGVPVPVPPPGVPMAPPSSPFESAPPAPAIDPSNPLSAVAAPYRPQAPVPAQPQRIEVDDMAVGQASKAALKKGVAMGGVLALFLGAIGFVLGSSVEQSSGRAKAVKDARELEEAVTQAKAVMTTMAQKMEDGTTQLKKKAFPDGLARDLGGINVPFDGTVLAGRRFSGFTNASTMQLVEFITAVQALNDRKGIVIRRLTELEKPIKEQFAGAASGKTVISHVVAFSKKDESGNMFATLASLKSPVTVTPPKVELPGEFTFVAAGQTMSAPKYAGGDLSAKASAIYVTPGSFSAACPNENAGAQAQLAVQMMGVVRDIKGEQQAAGEGMPDPKPGLIERADRLIAELQKIKN